MRRQWRSIGVHDTMKTFEKVIKFKYAVDDLKKSVRQGNQLMIAKNGQYVAIADYDATMVEIIETALDALYEGTSAFLKEL